MNLKFILVFGALFIWSSWESIASEVQKNDSLGLKNLLQTGRFHGHSRNYFMATDNSGQLSDYYALAIGAGIGYKSPSFYGFEFGMSGFFIFNLASSDLNAVDSLSGSRSRYELGNFDMEDPTNHGDLDRLEELYIRYRYQKSSITWGRQNIKTPFINPQDGRMRPSLQEGLWLESKELDKLTIKGGFFYKMSPRSTVNWYRVGESIGKYPVGRDVYGNPSLYKNNVRSEGLGILGILYKPLNSVEAQFWYYNIENVFALNFLQLNGRFALNQSKTSDLLLGFQTGYQQATGDGGNADTLLAYIKKGSRNHFVSTQLGVRYKKMEISANYTQIGGSGRFLMPREWGIEPFYTFMPRERMEGSSDSRALVFKSEYKPNKQWKLGLAYGRFVLPDAKDFVKNKNALPSFYQFNSSLSYEFSGYLNGLSLQALYVYKGATGDTYDNPKFIINRVNMSNYNLILNYYF